MQEVAGHHQVVAPLPRLWSCSPGRSKAIRKNYNARIRYKHIAASGFRTIGACFCPDSWIGQCRNKRLLHAPGVGDFGRLFRRCGKRQSKDGRQDRSAFHLGTIISLMIVGGIAGFVGQVAQNSLGRYWKIFAGIVAVFFGLAALKFLPFKVSFGKFEGPSKADWENPELVLAGLILGGIVAASSSAVQSRYISSLSERRFCRVRFSGRYLCWRCLPSVSVFRWERFIGRFIKQDHACCQGRGCCDSLDCRSSSLHRWFLFSGHVLRINTD